MHATETPAELQGCELCSHEYPIETMTMSGDLWLCPQCEGQWQEHFAKCKHVWVADAHDGVSGFYCEKCTGFVEDRDMAALFPEHARMAPDVTNGDRASAKS